MVGLSLWEVRVRGDGKAGQGGWALRVWGGLRPGVEVSGIDV